MSDPTRAPAFATPVFVVPNPGSQQANLTDEAGHLLKTGAGTFLGISVNQAQADGTLEVIDGVNGAGTVLGTFTLKNQGPINAPAGGWNFAVGLFVITQGTGTANVTVSYV